MRPYADRMAELMAGTAKAARRRPAAAARAARGRQDGRDRPDHRRPRHGRRVQRAGAAPLARDHARGPGRGQEVRFYAVGKKAASTAPLPPAAAGNRGPGSATSRLRRRPGGRPRARRGVRERGGRPRRRRLQRLRLAARPAGDGQRVLPIPLEALARRRCQSRRSPTGRAADRAPARLLLRARAAGHPRAAPARSTSRPSSTARCSSRPPRSSAPR